MKMYDKMLRNCSLAFCLLDRDAIFAFPSTRNREISVSRVGNSKFDVFRVAAQVSG